MKKEKLTSKETKKSKDKEVDIISQMIKSGSPMESILSLGFTVASGSVTKKKEGDAWNMMVVLTSNLHMVISEATKPKRERNEFKMDIGLKSALEQSDNIYKTFPKILLEHELSGESMPLCLGYVGLIT
jgi:hypothetical protein